MPIAGRSTTKHQPDGEQETAHPQTGRKIALFGDGNGDFRAKLKQKPNAQRTLLFVLTCATSLRVHSAIKRCSDQGTIRFFENRNRVFLDGETRAEAFASARAVASWRP